MLVILRLIIFPDNVVHLFGVIILCAIAHTEHPGNINPADFQLGGV